jgi:hypothetical protein
MTSTAKLSWACPRCQAPNVPTYTLTMVRYTQAIPMYCARCDTAWTLTADQRTQLLTALEERAPH